MASLLAFLYFCFNLHGLSRGQTSNAQLAHDATENMIALIAEEKQLRMQLEAEAQTLEDEINAIKRERMNVTCACPGSYPPVTFSTTLTTDVSNIGIRQPIIYNDVILNVGDGYDVRHGVFTAPFDGVYEFTVSILMHSGYTTGIEIVKNGQILMKARSGDGSYWTMGMNAVTSELMKGDDVWVQHSLKSDSHRIYGQGGHYSMFSGYLIQ